MLEAIIQSKHRFSLNDTVTSHGWFQLAPWKWDPTSGILSRMERCPAGELTEISCKQISNKSLRIKSTDQCLITTSNKLLEEKITRWLSLEWNPFEAINLANKTDPAIGQLIELGGGRFLRGSSFYEDCIKTILTINANWQFTIRMVDSMVAKLGRGAFPTPSEAIQAGPQFLQKELGLGFRSSVIFELSCQLIEREIIDPCGNLKKTKLEFEDMIQFRGLGPYTVNHILMLLHDFEWIPIDSEVTKYCQLRYKLKADEIQQYFAEWGKFRFLGYKLRRIIDCE
jgi:3-methyladenine DNA glycosylase/8-oxoguanine DNA glycosylase